MSEIPIIGQPKSIPVEKVMEAMQDLESELHVYYATETAFMEEQLKLIKEIINTNHTSSEMIELITEILERKKDELQEEEV